MKMTMFGPTFAIEIGSKKGRKCIFMKIDGLKQTMNQKNKKK